MADPDYDKMSDAELHAVLTGAPPLPAGDQGVDYSKMSDAELHAVLTGPLPDDQRPNKALQADEVPAAPGSHVPQNDGYKASPIPSMAGLKHDLGTAVNEVKDVGGKAVDWAKGKFAEVMADPKKAALAAALKMSPMGIANSVYEGGKTIAGAVGDVANRAINDPAALARDTAHAVVNNPVQSAATVLSPLPAPGGLSGEGARAVVGGAARAVDTPVRLFSELTGGVSTHAQDLAQEAGRVGSPGFARNMVRPDWAGMQETGQAGIQLGRREREAEYLRDMQGVAGSVTPTSYAPIGAALQTAADEARGVVPGFTKSPEALNAVREAHQSVRQHLGALQRPPTAIEMDALKQRVGRQMMALEEGTPERRAVAQVHTAIGDEIRRAAPEYGAAMDNYGMRSDNLTEGMKSLGLGERSTRFSTGGKLLSAMRADASVARGARVDALADLDRHVPDLKYQIAGATMNPRLPRGIVGRGKMALAAGGATGSAGAGALGLTAALAKAAPAALLASPRFVGRARYMVGQGQRLANGPLNLAGNVADRGILAALLAKQNSTDTTQ